MHAVCKRINLINCALFPSGFFFFIQNCHVGILCEETKRNQTLLQPHITEQQQATSSFSIGFTMASHMSPPLTLLSKIARFSRNGQMHLQMDFSRPL